MARREATLAGFRCLLPVRQLWRAEAEKKGVGRCCSCFIDKTQYGRHGVWINVSWTARSRRCGSVCFTLFLTVE